MTLEEAMAYRREDEISLAQALDGGVLVTADGAEVELYGNGGNER